MGKSKESFLTTTYNRYLPFSFKTNSFASINIPSLISLPLTNLVAAQELNTVDKAVTPIQAVQDLIMNSFLFMLIMILQRFQKFNEAILFLYRKLLKPFFALLTFAAMQEYCFFDTLCSSIMQ